MAPEIRLIFRLGQLFGFLPFTVVDNLLVFKWHSWQVVYFCAMFTFCLASEGFVVYGFFKTFLINGLGDAMLIMPWVAAFGSNILAMVAAVWKQNDMVNYVNMAAKVHAKSELDGRYNITKRMWKMFGIWFILSSLVPQVTVNLMAVKAPVSLRSFYSSELCTSDDDCPIQYMALSMIFHSLIMFYTFLCIQLHDILPMANAMTISNWMKIVTDHMLEHSGREPQCSHYCVDSLNSSSKSRRFSSIIVMEIDQFDEERALPQKTNHQPEGRRDLDKVAVLRKVMQEHLEIQSLLETFNVTFAPFILVFIAQVFAMCIVCFFGPLFSERARNLFFFLAYIGNGMQYLLRGSLILNSFGNVREEAERLRSGLLLKMDLFQHLGRLDPFILQEVQLFITSLDSVYVQGGPYIHCTHSFLFTFYGVLATYIAILYQSF